jgi:hypothetical protein
MDTIVEDDMIGPEAAMRVMDRVNDHFVYDGLPQRLEHMVPLVQFNACAGEFGLEFCGLTIWDTVSDNQYISENALEHFVLTRLAEMRKVINHVTIGIPNSVLDLVIDEAEEKL